MKKIDFLVLGNYSHDYIIINGVRHLRLGGPPLYISKILDCMEADYWVITKVGSDFKYIRALPQKPILTRKPTCVTEHESIDGRITCTKILERCDQIFPQDIRVKGKVAVIGGHVNEIPPETVHFLRNHSELIVADVKGFIRTTDMDGNVVLTDLQGTDYWDVLEDIDFLKVNQQEADHMNLEEARKLTKIILTLGKEGCKIIDKDKELLIQTRHTIKKDSRGAGDFFLAGFCYGLWRGFNIRKCGELGNYCGSMAITHTDIPNLRSDLFRGFR